MAISRFTTSSLLTDKRSISADAGRTPLPYTPTIGTATDLLTGSDISVAFTPPTTVPAGTYYQALSNPGSLTGYASSSPVAVSGLTTGTAYTFQVASVNATGASAYSSASNSATPAVNAFASIATVTAAGGETSLSFTSIPTTFTHLQIRGILKLSGSSTTNSALQFNNDTAGNYTWHYGQANGLVTAVGTGGSSITSILSGQTTANSSNPGNFIIDIYNYKNTNTNKTTRSILGNDQNGSGSVLMVSGLWMSTAAISSMLFTNNGTSFAAGSTFTLYGVN